jgi:hypothetical protein
MSKELEVDAKILVYVIQNYEKIEVYDNPNKLSKDAFNMKLADHELLVRAMDGIESRKNDPYNAMSDERVVEVLNQHLNKITVDIANLIRVAKREISNAYDELYSSLVEAPEGSIATLEFRQSMRASVERSKQRAYAKLEEVKIHE